MYQQPRSRKRSLKSRFTATAGKYFFLKVGCLLLSLVPFFGLPNAICIWNRYRCRNMTIVGIPLEFDGKPGDFLKNCFVWGFFSVITGTIYLWTVAPLRYRQWVTANTVFGPIA